MPRSGALNEGGDAEIFEVSCPSVGNCLAGGWYMDSSGDHQAFVVDESNRTWHRAIELPGTASAGRCAANGSYLDGSDDQQVFVTG